MKRTLNGRDLLKIFDILAVLTPADVEKYAAPEHLRKRISKIKFTLNEEQASLHLPENVNASNVLEVLSQFDEIYLPFEVDSTLVFPSLGVTWMQFLHRVGIT